MHFDFVNAFSYGESTAASPPPAAAVDLVRDLTPTGCLLSHLPEKNYKPRAGDISVESDGMYEQAINLIQQHARNGVVLAKSECPEVYFLPGLRNPTPNDGTLGPTQFLDALQAEGFKVVVINVRSTFSSGTLTQEVGAAIREISSYRPTRQILDVLEGLSLWCLAQ